MKQKKRWTLSLSICFILAFVLGVVFINFEGKSRVAFAEETLPSAYQNDYQDLTYISAVKDQGSTGMCWAFSTIAVAEADAVKNHGASKTQIDLSEWHLAYFLYHGERVGTGDSVEYVNTSTPYYSIGGNDTFSAYAMSNWIGLADESVAPFSELENNLTATISQDKMTESSYIINNVHDFDVETDAVEMKKAIMEYGAITLSYNQSTAYLNSSTYAQYCPTETSANHMVTVVGFDDNYARENFSYVSRPSSNGAWLVKNSWGTDWGLDGYFWLSYEDKSISTAALIDVVPASKYTKNYQHDGGISSTCLTHDAGVVSNYANAFTAESKEILTAVGVYIQGVADGATDEDYNYTINVYKNPPSLDPSSSLNFSFGTPVSTVSGAFRSSGFSTIPLTNAVYLETGDDFVIEVETSAFIGIDMAMDIEANTSSGVQVLATSTVSVGEHESFVHSGVTWQDVYDKATQYNFRIKGFTVSTEVGETVVKTAPVMIGEISYGQALRDELLSGGVVVDGDTNAVLEGSWSFKDKNAIVYSGQQIEIVFTPSDVRYQSVETQIYANVYKTKPTLTLCEMESTAFLGANIYVNAFAENPYNSELEDFNNISLYVQINGGVKNEILNNYYVVPNGMLDGSSLTFSAEYNGDDYKYDAADVVTKTVTVRSQFRISLAPTVSSVKYGENLSSSVISGGKVLDTSINTEVDGEWVFNDGSIMPSGETNVKLDFYRTGEQMPLLSTTAIISTTADKPNISLSTEKNSYEVGDKVDISVVLTNKYNDALNDFGKYTLYYIIGDSEEMVKISETKGLVVPEGAKGKTLEIVVIVEGVDGKYAVASASVKVNVLSGVINGCFSSQNTVTWGMITLIPAVLYLVVKQGKRGRKDNGK